METISVMFEFAASEAATQSASRKAASAALTLPRTMIPAMQLAHAMCPGLRVCKIHLRFARHSSTREDIQGRVHLYVMGTDGVAALHKRSLDFGEQQFQGNAHMYHPTCFQSDCAP